VDSNFFCLFIILVFGSCGVNTLTQIHTLQDTILGHFFCLFIILVFGSCGVNTLTQIHTLQDTIFGQARPRPDKSRNIVAAYRYPEHMKVWIAVRCTVAIRDQ